MENNRIEEGHIFFNPSFDKPHLGQPFEPLYMVVGEEGMPPSVIEYLASRNLQNAIIGVSLEELKDLHKGMPIANSGRLLEEILETTKEESFMAKLTKELVTKDILIERSPEFFVRPETRRDRRRKARKNRQKY